MALPRSVAGWVRVTVALLVALPAGLLRLAFTSGLTLCVASAPIVGWYMLGEERTARTEGWHGTLTVQRCDKPYSSMDEWLCVGRFRSDDTEHTVEDVEVEVEEQAELIEGWITGPDGEQLYVDPIVAPTWVIVLLAVIAILVVVIGLGYAIVTAIGWGLTVAGYVSERLENAGLD